MELITPPVQLLGNKKQPADTQNLWAFVHEQINCCDCAVLSAEMLFFGGLLPSRLHHDCASSISEKIAMLRSLKQSHPDIPLYLFELIMRTPRYDSSDEEPEYYGSYGARIFQRAYLKDKEIRLSLTPEERQRLEALEHQIPHTYIQDYEQRRSANLAALEQVLELVQDGTIELLYIPQDDSCEFGYTAMDQARIRNKIAALKVQDRVYLHPGADEAGAELVARAYLELVRKSPRIYVAYSSTAGAAIIPLYEDRSLKVSIEQHISACGCTACNHPGDADFILAVNTPGKTMQESFQQRRPENADLLRPCLRPFVQQLSDYIAQGKHVAVADCAYANGGEITLIEELDRAGILDHLVSYKGWNTACNTIGSSLAQGIFALDTSDFGQIQKNLRYHILDDAFYQSVVRGQLRNTVISDGCSYFDLHSSADLYARMCETLLNQIWSDVIRNSFPGSDNQPFHVYFPWNRLFELGIIWTQDPHEQMGGMPSVP